MISVIIPTFNEEKLIEKTIVSLFKEEGDFEIIIVDGESLDNTAALVVNYPVKLILSEKNRGLQMNEGAKAAKGNIFLFLHADCFFDKGSFKEITSCIKRGFVGGCFKQRITDNRIIYRCIEFSGNIRAKFSKTFYGDQAIFVRKDVFFSIGGFEDVDLFDDVIFSKKLKKKGRVCVLDKYVYTLPRRWEKQGIVKTTGINWLVSLGFMAGINPKRLKKIYHEVR